MRNRTKYKEKMSRKGRQGAEARWAAYHKALADEPILPEPPVDLYELTFRNLVTGKTEVLLFHPGPRRNNYRIDVNGKPWRICGFHDALGRIEKSCYKMAGEHQLASAGKIKVRRSQ